jgi:uncharacterized RDD family membrane protein YckC
MTRDTPPLDTYSLHNASLWRRLAALVYDSFLLFGLLVAPLLVLQALLHWSEASSYGTQGVAHELPGLAPTWVLQVYWLVVITGFYCTFWLRNHQTLGMQAWRLQLETVDGSPLTLKHCLLRMLVGTLSLICAGLGFLWCLLPAHRTWHDIVSGTRVVVHDKR